MIGRLAIRCVIPGLLFLAACGAEPEPPPAEHPAQVVTLRLPDRPEGPPTYRLLQRPAVFFDHAGHLEALGNEDCFECHGKDEKGLLLPSLRATEGVHGRKGLERAYHEACIGCHRKQVRLGKKAAPVLCGDCHGAGPKRGPAWSEIRFDLSLHQRHTLALEKKCERCHHVRDEATGKLVWKKNTEGACRDCHGPYPMPKKTSLADASHRYCVGCHLARRGKKLPSGPADCLGCHTAGRRAGIKRLEKPPRLERGQKDRIQIHSRDVTVAAVVFDHLGHEQDVAACHECHHRTMGKCSSCHLRLSSPDGGGVSRERAYHDPNSGLSCNGCHRSRANTGDCRGCHWRTQGEPGRAGCTVCHRPPTVVEEGQPEPGQLVLDPLPEGKEDLPEKVEIKLLAKEYEPATMPHRKIVARLDAGVRKSRLAVAFHGRVETLCGGCHHHQPTGTKPGRCSSCHDEKGSSRIDKPKLYTAYHRQCIGCHQRMGLKQGCNDCHKPAGKEVSR